MADGDWLKKAMRKELQTEEVRMVWEMIVWGAIYRKKIPQIMGQISCEGQERKELKQFLYQEKKYELLVAMTYAEKDEKQQKKEGSFHLSKGIPFLEGEVEQKEATLLLQYQLLSFLQWCDSKDWEAIFENASLKEWHRLCYLALAVGYQKLALFFAHLIEEQGGGKKEGEFVFEMYRGKMKLLEKKWLVEFYRKQPEGKQKKRLAKRMVRYGKPLFV